MTKKIESADEVLNKMPDLAKTLNEEERHLVMQNLRVVTYKRHEYLYSEDQVPEDLFFVVSGKLKIYKDGASGKSQLILVAMPNSYLGYRPFFANQHYQTTAEALETTVVVQISLTLLNELMQQNARLSCFFVNELARHLGTAHQRAVNLTQKHLRGRLAEAILFLRDAYGLEEDGCTLSIYLSREDMANMSNMTTSNAIRTLSSFVQEHIIAMDGRKIKLIDEEALERINKYG